MLTDILKLESAQALNKSQQQSINGGGATNCSSNVKDYYECVVVNNGICLDNGVCVFP